MKEYYDVVNSKLMELYYVYESYIWKNEEKGININVIFEDNMIYFDLGKEEDDIDSFGVSFSEEDRDIYKYISLRFMISMLRCVVIHKEENVFYNDYHKPYLSVIVSDTELLSLMNLVKQRQQDEILTDRIDILSNLYEEIDKEKSLTLSFINNINSRVGLTRQLLRDIKV